MTMTNVMRHIALALTCLAIVGCTTVAPGPEGVQIANEPEAVAGCKPLGDVHAEPPDDLAKLRKQAFEMGADVVLVTRRGYGTTNGIAYRCTR